MSVDLVAGTESPSGMRTAGIRARLALEAGKMVAWEWQVERDEVIADQGFFELFGLKPRPMSSGDVFAAMHPDDLPPVEADVAEALENDTDYVTEFRVLLPDGTHRWIGARGAVTARGPDGQALRMLGINWDKSEQKLQEERLSMMADEMNHRVENGFAIMAALIQIGARTTDDKASYAERLRSQVQALAAAHRLAIEAARTPDDRDTKIEVGAVVKTAIAAWSAPDDDEGQVTTAFRTQAYLRPRQSSAVAMLTYELATNALKYGALSSPDGHLTVTVDDAGDGNAVLRWTERMPEGAPVPEDTVQGGGFGSILIEHCAKMLRGSVVRTMTPQGLRVEATFPVVRDAAAVRLDAVQAMVGGASSGAKAAAV